MEIGPCVYLIEEVVFKMGLANGECLLHIPPKADILFSSSSTLLATCCRDRSAPQLGGDSFK